MAVGVSTADVLLEKEEFLAVWDAGGCMPSVARCEG